MDVSALFELQQVDSAIDRALVAQSKLPERQRHEEMATRLAHIRAQRDDIRREQSVQESELAAIESRSSAIDVQRARLDKQLRTVIVPREAEALQHEIQLLELERNALDDRGLQLLESSSEADQDLMRLAGDEAELVAAVAEAQQHLDAALAASSGELEAMRAERDRLAATLDSADVTAYELLRRSYGGVAITVIEHGMCAGCNIDLSVAELDAIKRRATNENVECPNCNRLLHR